MTWCDDLRLYENVMNEPCDYYGMNEEWLLREKTFHSSVRCIE